MTLARPVTFEHTFHCNGCGLSEGWTTDRAAQAAAVWHVYEQHRDLWATALLPETLRPPTDPRPEEYGRRYDAWESQAPETVGPLI